MLLKSAVKLKKFLPISPTRSPRGQTIAILDNAEYRQAQTQAEADLAVAKANLSEAESLLKISVRELDRIEKLKKRGVSTDAEQDAAQANQLARAAHKIVTQAQLQRARAAVETARIRLDYSNIQTNWQGDDARRFVAERYVNEGESIGVNQPIIRVVNLDKLNAVFHVSERDYALLAPAQTVMLQTNAFPDVQFAGKIARIAPVFRETTRQARIEVLVNNNDLRLKPGMFMRAQVVLRQADNAVVAPEAVLVSRNGETGVFLFDSQSEAVSWRVVETGIHHHRQAEIVAGISSGKVVILGQQLIDDGSKVSV